MIGTSFGIPIRPKWFPRSWVAAALSGHLTIGVALSALLYIVCLTGTFAVFANELERWEQPAAPVVHGVATGALNRALEIAASRATGRDQRTVVASFPSPDMPRLVVSIGGHDGFGGEAWLANREGRLAVRVHHPVTDLLVGLHTSLLLPEGAGRILVGLLGIGMLALLISGVVAHPRMFRDAFTLRYGGARRIQQADLHNRLGTWGLPFHLMIAATGAMLGLFFVIFAALAASAYHGDLKTAFADVIGPLDVRRVGGAAGVPALDPILQQVRLLSPAASIRSVAIDGAGSPGQRITVRIEEPGDLSFFQHYLFDGRGRLISTPHAKPRSVGSYILTLLQPLHFGWFGGTAVKLLYGCLGLALCVVTADGMSIWLTRRRDQGHPAVVVEKLWSATVWGQPAALVLAAILSLAWPSDTAALWGWSTGSVVIFVLPLALWKDAALAPFLRASLAGLLVVLSSVHALRQLSGFPDHIGSVVDASLFSISVLMLAQRYHLWSPE